MKLAELLPAGVFSRELFAPGDPSTLLPDEAACAVGFAARRLREFAAGRCCARLALAEMGEQGLPLLVGSDRRPVWPAGIGGSITHSNHYCAAAVCRTAEIASLGIDAERIAAVDRSVWPVLFQPAEIDWLESLSQREQNAMAAALFSGKEAYFKCQFPLTGRWLDFQDVRLCFDDGSFAVLCSGGEPHPEVAGAYGVSSDPGVVLTTVVARRRGA